MFYKAKKLITAITAFTMTCYHALDGNLYKTNSASSSNVKLQETGSNSSRTVVNSSVFGTNLATQLKRNLISSHKCIFSKAAQLTLFWAFLIGVIFGYFYNLSLPTIVNKNNEYRLITIYIIVASFYCFYPLAGFLADVRFGRYKTILGSIQTLFVLLVISAPPAVLVTTIHQISVKLEWLWYIWALFVFLIVSVFCANSIQFGMDQLHDSPSDHQSLFIHWYVCVWYAGVFASLSVLMCLSMLPTYCRVFIKTAVAVALVFCLAFSLCIAKQKKYWFLIDSARDNPYKMVYKVTNFARHCKVPIQRSAFTYCEDEIPSGLDLGKNKYGGPFTVEQVEDVKAFYGILKIVLTSGPAFFLKIASDRVINDIIYFPKNEVEMNLFGNGLLSSLLILVSLTFYITFIRPFIGYYIPGILKRLGSGIILAKITLVSIFILYAVSPKSNQSNENCFYLNESSRSNLNTPIILAIPSTLNAFSNIIIYIPLYEFVCSQSPHAMKGFLIGLTFAVKGVFELAGASVLILFLKLHPQTTVVSCGMIYYMLNILVAVVSILIYVLMAKRYKYRLRDEICNVYQYAENYYSKKSRDEIS